MEHIGFIGLGSMGFPMARNLLKSGFSVTVYNRTAAKAQPLVQEGAQVVSAPCDVLAPGSVVITMVSNDQALEEVVWGPRGLGEKLAPGHVHISMSTISPETSKKLAAFHQQKGGHYVVATVSGRPEAAETQKLWIFLAGVTSAKQKIEKILKVLGQRIFDVGEDPTHGNIIKLCGNFLILSAVEAMSEAFAFAQKNGLSPKMVAQVFTESLFACPVYQIYGRNVTEAFFKPGFLLNLGLKDINLLRASAEQTKVPMPLASLLHQRLLTAMAKGRENLDWSAIALSSLEDAGLVLGQLSFDKLG